MEEKVAGKAIFSEHVDLKNEIAVKQSAEDSIAGVSAKEYNRILRKVDYRVIPILASLYLLSFLDRGKKTPSVN